MKEKFAELVTSVTDAAKRLFVRDGKSSDYRRGFGTGEGTFGRGGTHGRGGWGPRG